MGHVEAEERRILVAVDESEGELACTLMVSQQHEELRPKFPNRPYPSSCQTPHRWFPLKFQQVQADTYSHDVLYSQDWRDEQMACWLIEKAEKICEGYDVKVETKIEEGNPTDLICQMADTLAADLLVMGSHGYGPTARALMGSVSGDCVQKANCPVVVVKKPKA